MPKSKKKRKIVIPKFADFDTCSFCGSHNGPFTWITIAGDVAFACDDCYEKHFKKLFEFKSVFDAISRG